MATSISTVAEMRAALARANFRHNQVAARMGYSGDQFKYFINAQRELPEGFEEKFWIVVGSLAQEEEARIRTEADQRIAIVRTAAKLPALTIAGAA